MALAAALPQQPAVLFALFVVVVIQLWVVHTHGTLHTLVAIAAFSLLIALATPLLGLGSQALALQFAMISLAANSYFGLAVPGCMPTTRACAPRWCAIRSPAHCRARDSWSMCANDLQLAAQRDRPAVVIVADMDNLKAINDELGHAAGDAACVLSAALPRLPAGRPVAGASGGDEFATVPAVPLQKRRTRWSKHSAARSPISAGERPHADPAVGEFRRRRLQNRRTFDLDQVIARADVEMYADNGSVR